MTDHNTLAKKYCVTRERSLEICAPLSAEDHIPQPVPYASPPKWHLGHTTWFFEAFILKAFDGDYREFHPEFDFVFNSYYNGMGERIQRDHRGNLSQPKLDAVYAYRRHVDEALLKLIESGPDEQVAALIELGLNHEQQHQELLITDIKRMLSLNPLQPAYREGGSLVNDQNLEEGTHKVAAGIYEVGVNAEDVPFCYDNECGRHKHFLDSFSIEKSLVTNEVVMAFIEKGGYRDHRLWLDEGWTWLTEERVEMPMYWQRKAGELFYYTLGGVQPVDPTAIAAHLSHYEAAAIALWLGQRLPTEFEWEVASSELDWGQRWEHTNSAYLAYPRFKPAEGAVGEYNGKFMMNQMVLRGASVATAEGHSRRTYRNFFHPVMQWQFSGVRLISNA